MFSALDKSYVSEIDQFLEQLQKTVPLSETQQDEIAKYQRVASLRDDPKAKHKEDII